MPEKDFRSIDDIDTRISLLNEQKRLEIEKGLSSKDPEDIIKAKEYLDRKKGERSFKSYSFDPEDNFYNGLGYKQSRKSVTYDIQRRMSYTPVINSIITTRVNQALNYANFTTDDQREGWTIYKEQGRFPEGDTKKKTSKEEMKVIDYVASFLENGGLLQKWEQSDDFDDFMRKQLIDSLTFDQATFEIERLRNGKLYSYVSVDASTIRLLDTINSGGEREKRERDKYDMINGSYPIYAQVINSKIAEREIVKGVSEQIVFYPWELSFGIRNKTTDIRNNGYGKSELEVLVDIITYQLYGLHYNGNFFKQGSNPKGFFSIKGNVSPNVLNEFKQAWRDTVSGFQNSHKVPVFEGEDEVSWTDMQKANNEMEFQAWNDFLILMACSVYSIDPSELGWNFQKQASMFGQDGQKQRLDHSLNKGLKPLLLFLEQKINKYIVSEINQEYRFKFTGIDLEDETAILENDIKKVANGMASMEDLFKKHSGRDFDPEKDTILNSVWAQLKQGQQFGDPESNEAVDEMTGEPGEGVQNPFDEFDKAENPFVKSMNEYIDRELR